MPLRVAFDLDGTIADMRVVLRKEAERLFGEPEASSQPEKTDASTPDKDEPESSKMIAELPLTRRQQAELWDHVRTIRNFWVDLPEMEPGIVARIAKTAADRRWDVIFLTTRPAVAGDTVQIQSQRWLEAHGFALPSVFVVRQSRGKIADALELEAVVDDRPENCLDVVLDSKAKSILIWPRDPDDAPPGVRSLDVRLASTISEALEFLIKLDDDKGGRSLARSIRKLFGKETTV